ncbi:MAG: D-aminoacylase, partial [Acidimicrobiales bacterium]
GFECTLNPFLHNPVWAEVANLAPAERVTALAEPDRRRRLLDASGGADMTAVGGRLIEKYDMMFEVGDSPNYEPDPGETLTRRAERMGITAPELALDVLCGNGGTAMVWMPFSNFGHG